MKTHGVALLVGLLALAGCSHSLSGTYQAGDANDVAGLQLTENQNQQLMGSMSVVGIAGDGSLTRKEFSITGGATDGRTITLTMKADEIFGGSMNVAGSVSGSGIDLTFNDKITHFSASDPAALANEVSALEATAKARRENLAMTKQRAKDTETVAALARDLQSYNEREANPDGMSKAKSAEVAVLVAARKDLAIKRQLDADHRTYQAGQAAFRIGQLDYQMGQIRYQVGNAISTGSDDIAALDRRLAANPCNATSSLQGCSALDVQQQRYSVVRARIRSDIAQMQTDIRDNSNAMDALNKSAGN